MGALTLALGILFFTGGKQIKAVEVNNEPIVDLATAKQALQKMNNKVTALSFKTENIPTVKEVNDSLNNMNVSTDNPFEKVELGNGFSVEMGVSSDVKNKLKQLQAKQSKTATGYYAIKLLGMKLYDIRVSDNYTYEYGKKIIKYQNPPSASASGFAGWTGKITNKKINNIDRAAKDAIADANYIYFKIGGNRHGHMELRFTATGNWYTHNVSIK